MSTTDTAPGDRREEQKVQLTEREVERLEFQAPRARDELLIRLGARCGLRVSEAVGWERPDGELPCWPCYRDGFRSQNPDEPAGDE